MKKIIISILALSAVLASCEKDDTKGGGNEPKFDTTVTAETPADYLWREGDALGIYTSDDMNLEYRLVSGAGESAAVFDGAMTEGASIIGAYYPYDAAAGENLSGIKLELPATVEQNGDATDLAHFAVGVIGEDGTVSFKNKLATMRVSFVNVAGSTFENETVRSIVVSSAVRGIVGEFNASVTSATSPVVVTSHSTNAVTMNFADAAFTDALTGTAAVAPTLKGNDALKVTLDFGTAEVSADIALARSANEGTMLDIEVDAALFEPKIVLEWQFGGLNVLNSFKSHTPAIDGEGNVYVTTADSKEIFKISPAGELVWHREISSSTTQNTSPSIEADGSAVYACGGNGTGACVRAFTADGTEKWSFTSDKFFGNGATPNPSFNQMAPAVGDECIYIGNAGTTGSVLSIDKATGERRAYVSGKTDGTGGPAGGVNSGMAVTQSGVVAWHSAWGTYGANASLLANPEQTHAAYGAYVPYGVGYRLAAGSWKQSRGGVACTNVDGEDCIAFFGVESNTLNIHVICAPAAGGLGISAPSINQNWKFDHVITGVKEQDQGGIVVGARGELIVPLKNNNGDGGLYAVSADGQKAWQFKCGADVAGAAAVDNEGNVHFVDDEGKYRILAPNYGTGECDIVAETDLYELVKSSGAEIGTATGMRGWTSVMIGNDGKMYVGAEFHTNWNDRHGRLLCLSYWQCKGAGNTPWPMKYADCRHTCVQKRLQ